MAPYIKHFWLKGKKDLNREENINTFEFSGEFCNKKAPKSRRKTTHIRKTQKQLSNAKL